MQRVSVTIDIDRDVLDAFQADGPGWELRMAQALRRAAGLPEAGTDGGIRPDELNAANDD